MNDLHITLHLDRGTDDGLLNHSHTVHCTNTAHPGGTCTREHESQTLLKLVLHGFDRIANHFVIRVNKVFLNLVDPTPPLMYF